ncbi:proton myo-inositol cotransporter [Elysia marginata]|uniref:Proton myo-inositol cotransporter n=1 Tax=Elysia marginata TaxID=1093978 RepID=A0AAV4HJT6_9GAST|nr:proton myo-inositol cotransporter [Elysia marginata]
MTTSKVHPEEAPGQKPPKEKHPFIIYVLTMCATIGGFLFGYNLAIINGANLLIKEEFGLDDTTIEHIVSSTQAGAALFSLLSGVIADTIGRKVSIMIAGLVFTIGAILMGFANGSMMLLIGRVIVGAAIGVVSSVVPVYVSECAPNSIRGRLITLNQLFITLGIFISSILAGAFQHIDNGWRYMLGLAAIPGAIQFVCFFMLPESPRWQVMRNQIPKAKATLMYIRAKEDVNEELDELTTGLDKERSIKGWKIWKGIFTTSHIRYTLLIGCMLQFFQQFCGINTVIFYSANILKSAGFNVKLAIWLSVIPFTVNFLATFLGLWAVEVLGRTKVLIASYAAIAVALWVLVVAFIPTYLTPAPTSMKFEMNLTGPCIDYTNCWDCTRDSDCAFCGVKTGHLQTRDASCLPRSSGKDKELFSSIGRCSKIPGTEDYMGGDLLIYSYGYCPSQYASLAVVGLILFVLCFAPGAGPMPWTINAEIYPMWCRSVANSLATVSNWVSNFLISNFFLTVTKLITTWGTFLVFSVICLISAAFTWAFVPETKNRSLEEIELLFMSEKAREAVLASRPKPRSSMDQNQVPTITTSQVGDGEGRLATDKSKSYEGTSEEVTGDTEEEEEEGEEAGDEAGKEEGADEGADEGETEPAPAVPQENESGGGDAD